MIKQNQCLPILSMRSYEISPNISEQKQCKEVCILSLRLTYYISKVEAISSIVAVLRKKKKWDKKPVSFSFNFEFCSYQFVSAI